jgi:hypothetical protein
MHQVFQVLDEKVQGLQLVGENLLQGAEVGGDLRCYERDFFAEVKNFVKIRLVFCELSPELLIKLGIL